SYVVSSIRQGKPGMVLLRNPHDAAISWSIFESVPLEEALPYYLDFYSVILPFRRDIHVVSFDDLTTDFGRVMVEFNERWKTTFRPFDPTPENVASCMSEVEEAGRDRDGRDGRIRELRVSRPSEL